MSETRDQAAKRIAAERKAMLHMMDVAKHKGWANLTQEDTRGLLFTLLGAIAASLLDLREGIEFASVPEEAASHD